MYKFIVASERLHLVYSPSLQHQPQNQLLLGFILKTFLYTSTFVLIASIVKMKSAESLSERFLHSVSLPFLLPQRFPYSELHLPRGQFRTPSLEDADSNHIFNKCIYGIFLFVKISRTDTIMTTHEPCTVYLEQKQIYNRGTWDIHQPPSQWFFFFFLKKNIMEKNQTFTLDFFSTLYSSKRKKKE